LLESRKEGRGTEYIICFFHCSPRTIYNNHYKALPYYYLEDMKKIAVLAVAFLLFIPFASINGNNVALTNSTNGNVLYVGGSGLNNYTSIQEAINDAEDGDTIIVYPGIYVENIVIYRELKIIGTGYPIIEAENRSRDAVKIISSNCAIEGFKITNGQNGIKMIDCVNNNIKNCSFYGNNYSALYLKNVYNVFVTNNIFSNEGIYMKECGNLAISNNNFTNGEIFGEKVYETKITHNAFFNGEYTAIDIQNPSSHDNEISHNQIKFFNTGISIQGSAHVYHNDIVSNSRGIWCFGEIYGKLLIYENNLSNNGIGIDLMDIPFDNVKITKNNFIGNEIHAGFIDSYFVLWYSNYWDNWCISLPKPIFGRIFWFIPWIQFDWHPLMQPYEWWKE